MALRLPRYSGKNYLVLGITVLPFVLGINTAIFGGSYFKKLPVFFLATAITGILGALEFILCGAVAAALKKRMSAEHQVNRRLVYTIIVFMALSGVFLLTVFHVYEMINSFHYTFNEKGLIWTYLCMAILTIFFTLVMEGISRYNSWRENLKETEQIKKAFTQSQILGLKSQVNPHFLFNSLNTLSSLIAEDEKEAEVFLNEMSKWYRYMLRGDEEQLVTVQTELKSIKSYTHLLQKRFGQSLQVHTLIHDEDLQKLIPPLSLQVLIENAFTLNSMSKTRPLQITICSTGNHELLVKNTRQPKAISHTIDFESGLDNLVTKYRLLNAGPLIISEEAHERSIFLPLIESKGGLT
jgi:two-component system LytT family sensor kinase